MHDHDSNGLTNSAHCRKKKDLPSSNIADCCRTSTTSKILQTTPPGGSTGPTHWLLPCTSLFSSRRCLSMSPSKSPSLSDPARPLSYPILARCLPVPTTPRCKSDDFLSSRDVLEPEERVQRELAFAIDRRSRQISRTNESMTLREGIGKILVRNATRGKAEALSSRVSV